MEMSWSRAIVDQIDFYWNVWYRARVKDLTDDEYFWEPVGGCWTVRMQDDGTFMCDWASPAPDPPPVTTIAWRLAHLAANVFGFRANTHFGDGRLTIDDVVWRGSADEALAWVEESYEAWMTGVRAMDDEAMSRPIGLHPGKEPEQFAAWPFSTLVLHINREAIHHAAEVAVLRDLYRAKF